MTKEEKIKILDDLIHNIETDNWSSTYNGGVSYSKEITDIFKLLNLDEYENIYGENHMFYNEKELEKNKDAETYSLIECIVYFNYIWHVDGSCLASGLVENRIKNGKYLKVLKQLKKLLINGF